MVKFIYKLDNVLKLKSGIYDQLLVKFQEMATRVQAERKVLEELRGILEEKRREFGANQGNMKASILRKMSKEIAYFKGLEDEQKIKLEKLIVEETKIKDELIKAYREKRIQEKLKEKQYEEYLLEEKAKEQKQLDEAVSNRYKSVE